MTLAEKLQQLRDDTLVIEDPQERLAFIIDRARRIPPLSAADRSDDHRVRGCVSVVWIVCELHAGRCRFRFDANSPVVRGLLALLCAFYADATPTEIVAHDADPLAELGLLAALSPTRRNGLASARARIRDFARSHA